MNSNEKYDNFFQSEVDGGNIHYTTFEIEQFLNNDPIVDEGLVTKILNNCTKRSRERKARIYLRRVKELFCKEKLKNANFALISNNKNFNKLFI